MTHNKERVAALKESIAEGDWDGAARLLFALRPTDRMHVLNALGQRAEERLLPHLDSGDLASLFEKLRDGNAGRLARGLDQSTLSQMLDQADPKVAAHLLREFPSAQCEDVLSHMEQKDRIEPLLHYACNTAGGHMTQDFVTLLPDMTVDEAIASIRRQKPPRDTIDVLYVVDDEHRLQGKLSLRELLLADSWVRLEGLMDRDVASVRTDTEDKECTRLMAQQNLSMLPVVDQEERLVGVIPPTESLDVAEEQATADMYHMIGLSSGERVFGPLRDSVRRRLPWLCINLGTAILAGFIVNLFESTIARAVALAAFLPIIAGQGANAGSQTLTIIVRSLALGEVTFDNVKKAIFKEVTLALTNGAVIGIVAGVVAYVWMGDLWLGVVLAVAMFLTMIVAGVSGALSPVVLKLLRIDPALASTVVVTTITDVCGFLFLLGVATIMLGYLA